MSTLASEPGSAHQPWRVEYWLGHCEGYGVESRRGHVGFVEGIVEDSETGEPCALLVRRRGGPFTLVVVAIEQVTAILPRAEEIVVELDTAP